MKHPQDDHKAVAHTITTGMTSTCRELLTHIKYHCCCSCICPGGRVFPYGEFLDYNLTMAMQVRDAALPVKQQSPDAAHAAAQHAETGTAPCTSQVRDTATSARETVSTSAQTAADKAQAATEPAQSVSQGVAADVFTQASAVATASVQYIKDKAQAAQAALAPKIAETREALAPQLDKAQQAVSDTAAKASSSSSSDFAEQATEVAASASEQASAAADGAQKAAAPVTTRMSQAASDAKDKALEYASAAEPVTGQIRSTAAAAWDKAAGTAAGAVSAIQGSSAWHQAVSSTVAAADAVRSSAASAVDAVSSSATGSAHISNDEQPENQVASGELGLDGKATLGKRVSGAISSAKRTVQDATDTGRNWAASLGSEGTLAKIDGAVHRTAQSAVAASQEGKQVVNAASTMIQQRSAGQAKAGPIGKNQDATAQSMAGHDLQVLKVTCQKAIRTNLNPLFKLEQVFLRESLPRTASNKVMRRVLRDELRHTVAKL